MSNINRDFFIEQVRLQLFDGRVNAAQREGLHALLNYWEARHARKDDRWLAYALATVHHEVDKKFVPIKEYGGDRYFHRMYDIEGERPHVARRLGNLQPGDGIVFHGRGFVQMTGRTNYTYWQKRLNVDLTSDREAADNVLDLEIATQILFEGMIGGTFTGRKLSDYFAPDREEWENARKIINGNDKKALIASYGRQYYAAISYTTG